jgi:DNA mismatch repair protein MutL
VAVISLTVPHEDVDVNVHPTKAEVRFRRESEVFAALQQTVRQTLVAQAPVPALDPTSLTTAQDLRIGGLSPAMAQTPWPGQSYPLPSSQAPELTPPADGVTSRQEYLPQESQQALPLSRTLPALRVVGQVQETYIVAEGPDGMYLIDQHAAHECVVYERLRDAAAGHSPNAQGLLDSVVAELSLQQAELVEAQREVLERYGWQLEAFGSESYLIRAVPAVLTQKGPAQALVDLVDALLGEEPSKPWEERVMATLACHGAVRAGMPLAQAEMTEMVRLLEQTQQPHTCPHGRPTMVRLSTSHLEREFRRR